MSKYNLTDEEVNSILLSSPYALPSSPAQMGLGAGQIKKYFYNFIMLLAKKLNIHFEDLEKALSETDSSVVDVRQQLDQDVDSLTSLISKKISEHNTEASSHLDIRELVTQSIDSHNSSDTAHGDIRQWLSAVEESLTATAEKTTQAQGRADNAYNLAAGKSKIYPVKAITEMLTKLSDSQFNVGDMFVVAEENVPDFTVYEYTSEMKEGDVEISLFDSLLGIDFVPGTIYFFDNTSLASGPVRLLSSESGIDTSLLATKEELGAISEKTTSLENGFSVLDGRMYKIEEEFNNISVFLDEILETQNSLIGGESE